MPHKKIPPKTYFTVAGIIAILIGLYVAISVMMYNNNRQVEEMPIEKIATSTIQAEKIATSTQATTTASLPKTQSSYQNRPSVPKAPTVVYATPTKAGERVIFYTDKGFVPKDIVIAVGSTVRFINESKREMWVSNKNFAVTYSYYKELPNLDEGGFVQKGGQYEYRFGYSGDFEYFNKLYPFDGGTISVRETK